MITASDELAQATLDWQGAYAAKHYAKELYHQCEGSHDCAEKRARKEQLHKEAKALRKEKEAKAKKYAEIRDDLDHEYYLEGLPEVYDFNPETGCFYCRDIDDSSIWHGECRGLSVFEGWMLDYCDARWMPGGENYWEPEE